MGACKNVVVGEETLSEMRCQQECKQVGEVCGGPGRQTLPCCCGGVACKNVVVGEETLSEMRCQPECKQVGEVCGGPGRQTLPCCGGMGCMQLFGRDEMKCAPGFASLASSPDMANPSEIEPAAGMVDESS